MWATGDVHGQVNSAASFSTPMLTAWVDGRKNTQPSTVNSTVNSDNANGNQALATATLALVAAGLVPYGALQMPPLKPGFHYPSSRAELTSTRPVNSGSGNRALHRLKTQHKTKKIHLCVVLSIVWSVVSWTTTQHFIRHKSWFEAEAEAVKIAPRGEAAASKHHNTGFYCNNNFQLRMIISNFYQ